MSTSGTIPCPACGYNLQGLVTDRGATCPECSTRSTPEVLADHSRRHRIRTRRLYLLLLLTPVVWFAPILFGLGVYKLTGRPPGPKVVLLSFVAALAWSTAIEYLIFIHGRGDGRGPGRALSLCMALLVAVPITIILTLLGMITVVLPLEHLLLR